jgi:PAS domain S-box-containing protein
MNPEALYQRYQELQRYVGWTDGDARRVQSIGPKLEPFLAPLIDDFYDEIDRHPDARKVITGGQEQVQRLKGTLRQWLRDLLVGPYDARYVARRWKVGWRHVEIGLDQVYTNVALSRMRRGLLLALEEVLKDDADESLAVRRSLNTLLDLDLAIIEEAYQAEYVARQEKERSEAAFHTLVEGAPGMTLILRRDGCVAYFSPFAEELTGYTAADIRGKDFTHTLVPEPQRQACADEIGRIFAGQPCRGYEMPVVCRDGTLRWVVWNAQRLDDFDGAPAVLAVGQDITSLKHAQEKALQSERLAAIGHMMAGLAHESGNALARSQACLEMLTWEVQDRPDALDLITRIQKAQDHLRQLYEEVRGYAAPLKLEREPGDVRSVWRQAWTNLALHREGKDTALHESCDGADTRCPIDPFRLEQIFRNIFENSLAACPNPVRIDVTAASVVLEGKPALQVSVLDNGPGLNPEQRKRIFEPFFTTKTKGTGLGMAIAKRIAEAHGGRIAVGPATTGKGAEIILTLPRELP